MNRSRTRAAFVAATLVALILAGCSGAGPSGSPSPASASPAPSSTGSEPPLPSGTPPSSAEPAGDLGPFSCLFPAEDAGTVARAQLTDVRIGQHADYDRVVFEFADGIPAFAIDEVSPPLTQDPSGLPLEVEGSYFWQLVLNGGTAVTPDGSRSYDGPDTFAPGFPRLVELANGGDFEAVSTWYFGMSAETCIRVLKLGSPARLVIDVEH